MKSRKLILHGIKAKNRVLGISVSPPAGLNLTKEEYVNQLILDKLNEYNPNLNVTSLEFDSDLIDGIHSDCLSEVVEERYFFKNKNIPNSIKLKECNEDIWYYSDNDGNLVERRRIAYVYLSDSTNSSRNAIGAQDLFPTLLEFMDHFRNSPSFTYSNHPIYYLNILKQANLSYSLVKVFCLISLLKDTHLVNVFPIASGITFGNQLDIQEFLKHLAELVRRTDVKSQNSQNKFNDLVENTIHKFDFDNKIFTIKTDTIFVDIPNIGKKSANHGQSIKDNGQQVFFNGSTEKFYLFEILGFFELAMKNDYQIDYSQLEEFCIENYNNDTFVGNKLSSVISLLNYIKKRVGSYEL